MSAIAAAHRLSIVHLCTSAGLTGYVWDGSTYRGELDAPDGGESASMSHLRTPYCNEVPEFFEVPTTLWGDYCGSDLGRSNHRSLLRDYSETFVDVTGHYWSHYLVIPVAVLERREDAQDMVNLFTGLRDEYPLYDECDHGELETELATEAWSEWVRFDLTRDLRDALTEPDSDSSRADEIVDAIDETELCERFYLAVSDTPQPFYLESADSVVFPYWKDVVTTLAEHYSA